MKPCKAVGYYIWFLGACLALLAFCTGCGDVKVPDITIVGPSTPTQAQLDALPLSPRLSIAYVLPVMDGVRVDPSQSQVWMTVSITNNAGPVDCEWTFGDGSQVIHTYGITGTNHTYRNLPGTWTATAKVHTLNGDRTASTSLTIVLP